MSKLSKFIAWNDALVDYFVRNGSTVWYVTDSVIEHIGQKYGIDKDEDETFCDDFIKSVLFVKCGDTVSANSFFAERISPTASTLQVINRNVPTNVAIPTRENINTLIDFALFLAGNRFYYWTQDELLKKFDINKRNFLGDYLYLSYIIFILWGYNQYGNQKWSGVKELFSSNKLQFRDSNSIDPSKIASLFEIAIKDELLNNNCVRTDLDYIKYLKYHSVLTPGKRDVFEGVLYDHNIAFSEDIKYSDIRNWIWRVASKTSLNNFRDELLDNANRQYFETVIKSFDREEYREKQLSNPNKKGFDHTKGLFRFVVDSETQTVGLWATQLQLNGSLQNNRIQIASQIIPGNYYVIIKDETLRLSWEGYVSCGIDYCDDTYHIISNKNRDCYYFEIINNRWLVEVNEPDILVGKPCYFATKQDNEDLKCRHEAVEILNPFFLPLGWKLYYSKSYVLVDIEDLSTNDQMKLETRPVYARVAVEDAIKIKDENKSCFLTEAFPPIVFEGIEHENIKIAISDPFQKQIEYTSHLLNGKIYLDILDKIESGDIILKIYDSNDRRIDYNVDAKSCFSVRGGGSIQRFGSKEYLKFDKWSCLTNDECSYYSNNRIRSGSGLNLKWIGSNPPRSVTRSDGYHRLMAIIYALGETLTHKGKKAFPEKSLEDAIMYMHVMMNKDSRNAASHIEPLTRSKLKRIKGALCELGIINHYYDDGHYYQTNSACLIPTGIKYLKELGLGKKGSVFSYVYILGGAYSQQEFEMAINGAESIETIEQQDSILNAILPPMVKLEFTSEVPNCEIPVNMDFSYEKLLLFAGKMKDFSREFGFDEPVSPYPILEYSNNIFGNQRRGRPRRSEQLRLDKYEILDNDEIPRSVLKNYENYKHNTPVLYKRVNGELYFADERTIPYYVRRSLASLSGHVAKTIYAFGVDDFLNNSDEGLFARLLYYPMTGESASKIFSSLTEVIGSSDSYKEFKAPSDGSTTYIASMGIDLKMKACYLLEQSVNKWWLELRHNNKLVAFTDVQRDVFCIDGDKYFKVIKNHDETANQLLSKIVKLYKDKSYECDIVQYYNDYGIILERTKENNICPKPTGSREVLIMIATKR